MHEAYWNGLFDTRSSSMEKAVFSLIGLPTATGSLSGRGRARRLTRWTSAPLDT